MWPGRLWSKARTLDLIGTRPDIREVVQTVAKSRQINPSRQWVDRLSAGCDGLTTAQAVEYLEGEIDKYDLERLTAAIEYKRRELRILNKLRRHYLAANA